MLGAFSKLCMFHLRQKKAHQNKIIQKQNKTKQNNKYYIKRYEYECIQLSFNIKRFILMKLIMQQAISLVNCIYTTDQDTFYVLPCLKLRHNIKFANKIVI